MASAMVLLMFYPAPCVAKGPVDADGTRNGVMADSVALPEAVSYTHLTLPTILLV